MSEQQMYYLKVAWKASRDQPEESVVYAVVEFMLRHKNPPCRFILYPQMSLKWKPNNPLDTRQEITDLSLVIFTQNGYKIRCGVEAKRATSIMAQLPDANYIIHNPQVQEAFCLAKDQAMDQAKAAFKNNYCFDRKKPIRWILVVGPYWTPILLGPFSQADLTVRSHKPSPSEDFRARIKIDVVLTQPPPELEELYCFNSESSYDCLEAILKETDNAAKPYIDQMLSSHF